MQNYFDILTQIYKQANPTASDEEIKAKVEATDPKVAQEAMSPFDVNVSTTTVPMQGRPESLPSSVGGEKEGDKMPIGTTKSWEEPVPSEPVQPEPISPIKKQAPDAPTAPKQAPVDSSPLDTLIAGKSNDKEARDEMLADKPNNLLPLGLAGVADALGNAATAYGGKGASGTMQSVSSALDKKEASRKAEFETGLKNDPNSDISKHYKRVLGMMMNIKADDPKIANLSASQIAETLPEVEKYMAKQLSMEQIKVGREQAQANKELALSEKQDQFDERRWERLGAAVNQLNAGSRKAIGVAATANMRADRLLETARDPNVTPQDIQNMIADLQGVYKGGVPDQIMLAHGNYPSLVQELARISGIISNTPAAAKSPEIVNRLVKVTKEIKAVDNKVIGDNLGVNEVVFKELIAKDPSRWEALKNRVMSSTEAPSEAAAKASGAAPTQAEASVPVVSSQADYDRLPSGSQYKDANGKIYRKK